MKEKQAKKEDRRTQVTKQLLRASLIELMDKKPIEKISITELCNKAGINRGTFYLHYDIPYDILTEIGQEYADIMAKEILAELEQNNPKPDFTVMINEKNLNDHTLTLILDDKKTAGIILDRLIPAVGEYTIPRLMKNHNYTEVQAQLVNGFVFSGCLSAYCYYQNVHPPIQQMQEIKAALNNAIYHGIELL